MNAFRRIGDPGAEAVVYNKIIGDKDFIISDIVQKCKKDGKTEAFVRAGPRLKTHFDPKNVTAAIITCGGLCPGLNNVIRELVHSLHYLYGVKKIMGIK
jgi:6-phosphofructokinase 1